MSASGGSHYGERGAAQGVSATHDRLQVHSTASHSHEGHPTYAPPITPLVLLCVLKAIPKVSFSIRAQGPLASTCSRDLLRKWAHNCAPMGAAIASGSRSANRLWPPFNYAASRRNKPTAFTKWNTSFFSRRHLTEIFLALLQTIASILLMKLLILHHNMYTVLCTVLYCILLTLFSTFKQVLSSSTFCTVFSTITWVALIIFIF